MRRFLIAALFVVFTLTSFIIENASAQDSLWAGNFGPTGVDGTVRTTLLWGDSSVFGGEIDGLYNTASTTRQFIIYDNIDGSWKPQTVGPAGTNAEVRAMAVLDDDRLVVAGKFSFFRDGRTMANIAVMDKAGNWSTLSGDSTDYIDAPVNALVIHNGKLYVGGEFNNPYQIYSPGVVRWDATNGFTGTNDWIDPFEYTEPRVYTLSYSEFDGGRLYVAGNFSYEGLNGQSLRCVYLDPASLEYQAVDLPFFIGDIYAMVTDTNSQWLNQIAFGGEFDTMYINTDTTEVMVESGNIFIMDLPTSEIKLLDGGTNGPVYSLLTRGYNSGYDNQLMVGGEFDSAGAIATGPMAVWNDHSNYWNDFVPLLDTGAVYAFSRKKVGTIYQYDIGGSFEYLADSSHANNVIRTYTGSSVNFFGDGLERTGLGTVSVSDVEIVGSRYYATGTFNYGGGTLLNFVGYYDRNSQKWNALGNGVDNTLSELLVNGDTVYVAGHAMNNASGVPVNQIAMWDGTQWQAMGNGVPGANILDMVMDTLGNLYVSGYGFDSAGNVPVTGIAMWDGSEWSAVGGPIVSTSGAVFVFDMYLDERLNHIYICGQFNTVDGMSSPGAAKWDGTQWIPIGDPALRDFGSPRQIGRSPDGDIIIAGGFRSPNFVYRDAFSGDWNSYAGGILSGYATDLFVYGCDVFVCGDPMQYAGGVQIHNVGFWDGTAWDDMGGVGTNLDVYALDGYGSRLAIGGDFKFAGGKIAHGFTIWSGLKTANVEAGLDEYRPSYTDTLVTGSIFEISWDSTANVDAIDVEVSFNNGFSWQTIHTGVDPITGKLPWLVPDMNSDSCLIRISDASAPCVNNQGGRFTIISDPAVKVKWMTRYTGSYYDEPFVIGYHDWNFNNSGGNIWPDTVWKNIPYPEDFVFIPDSPKTFPDWYTFADAFGDAYCYQSGNPSNIRPRALEKWKNTIIKWGGSCLGFSISSSLWWKHNAFNTGNSIPDDYLFNFDLNSFSRRAINKHWLYQKGHKHGEYAGETKDFTAMQTLQTIRDDFFSYPRSLSFSWMSWKDKTDKEGTVTDSVLHVASHNVLPYKIEEFTDSTGIYYMYFYDSNRPTNDTRYARIDSINGTWSVEAYGIHDTIARFVPRLPINEWVGNADDDRLTTPYNRQLASSNFLYTSGTEEILVTDSSGGQVGWVNFAEVNTLAGSTPLFDDDPENAYTYPTSYLLPTGEYSVELSKFEEPQSRVSLELADAVYAYERSDADSTQTDDIYFVDGITAVNHDAVAKKISLTSIVTDVDNEYYLKLDSLSFAQDDSTIVNVTPAGAINIDNFGQAKQYNLILWYSSPTEDHYTQSLAMIDLGANSAHQIEPVWDNLESGSLTILKDNDMNGSYEDTTVADVATGVGDEEGGLLPDDYFLGQNYPNPFNPATTISFNLPTRSNVKLEVLNILGQRVATLADKALPAGEHKFEWNGTSDAGAPVASGVYFYRLIANDFTSTKKMLLLK